MVKKPTLASIQNLLIDGGSVSGGIVVGSGIEALYPQGQEKIAQVVQVVGSWGLAASMKTKGNKLARSLQLMLVGAGAVPVIKGIKTVANKVIPDSIKNSSNAATTKFVSAVTDNQSVVSAARLQGRYPLLASRDVVRTEWRPSAQYNYSNTIDVEHEEYPVV